MWSSNIFEVDLESLQYLAEDGTHHVEVLLVDAHALVFSSHLTQVNGHAFHVFQIVENLFDHLKQINTQGFNFTNILRAPFSYKSFARRFFVLAAKVNFLFAQEYWRNCANKMLLKLTQGVNFTNILIAAYAPIFLRQKTTNLKCKNKKAASKAFVRKRHASNVGEIDQRSQFHHYFKTSFCANFHAPKKY
jgi:hypothetical protein